MKRFISLLLSFSIVLTLKGQQFSEVAAANGINTGCGLCPVGSGVSFVDFNDDGLDDLTFATGSGSNILFYQNNGNGFTLIQAPITNLGRNEQILWVDFDNDGDRDLFVTNHETPNRLYRNDGNFQFTDVTQSAGLPLLNDPTYGAVFGDYNNDGWLDLYISNWTWPGNPTPNFLFRNNQDGTFTDVTATTQTGDGNNLTFCSAFFDYNNDGWQDIYNSQDRYYSLNTLFKNNGDGTFSDVSAQSNSDLGIDAMNVGVGDYDNDGYLDIYITNTDTLAVDPGNKMLRNNGDGTFSEVSAQLGVEMFKVTWGGNFFDFDNDLDLDLYVSTQHVGAAFASELFINDIENGVFIEANALGMEGDTLNSFSNAIGDFNDDGKPDIAVNNATPFGGAENKFHLWENNTITTNNWIKVDLIGVESNREGIGSWIEVYLDGNVYVRYKHCGIAYLAQNSATELIGLGGFTTIDSLKVKWLSGNENIEYNVPANQKITITENLAPLTVEWLRFQASQPNPETVLLNWATASEVDNEGFELQRCTDGVSFEPVAWINGNGNTFQTMEYAFEDRTIEPGQKYYYRLKQKDFDGAFKYSKIVVIQTKADKSNIVGEFFPNPTTGWTSLELRLEKETEVNIHVYDINGSQVFYLNENGALKNIEFSTKSFPTGIYFVKIHIEGEVYSRKLAVGF